MLSFRNRSRLTANIAKEPATIRASDNFIDFLLSEYGNLNFALDMAESVISFAQTIKKHSKKYQVILRILKYGIPATLLTTEFIGKIDKFRKIKSGKFSVYNDKEKRIVSLIGIKNHNHRDLYQHSFAIGRDILNWLSTEPPTKLFKILGYFDQNDLSKVNKISEKSGTFVLIEFKGIHVVWNLCISVLDEYCLITESVLYDICITNEFSIDLRMCFFKEFIDHFDIKNNVIYVHSSGIYNFPRKTIPENPIQFNIEKFKKETIKVLSKSKKRAVVFVGVPGVGKSTVIKKLESSIRDYPIIYTTPDCFSSAYSIKETFSLIQYIQPCIVIMEDMDSYDFKDKKKDLGVFLDEMDDVNGKLKAFFIATINDTSLVHYSLINRPGRFDQVYLLDVPKHQEEVYTVMKTRYDKNKDKDPAIKTEFFEFKEMDKQLLQEIIQNKFTQADICEIIEKALLLSSEITIEDIWQGLKDLESSKQAIASCNFSGKDPRSFAEYNEAVTPSCGTLSTQAYNFEIKGR